MENTFERRPWLLPILLALLTLILLRPVWAATGQALDGKDFQGMFYPLHEYIRQTLLSGELPLWNPHQFIGHPIIGNPHAALFYPATWFMWLVGTVRGLNLSMVFHAWLGAWGMSQFLRSFTVNNRKVSYVGSLLAGVVYGMSGWAAARFYAGHYNLFVIFGWIPWSMVAYRYALRRGTWRSALPGVIVFGVMLLAGYPPLVVYGGLALIALWVLHIAEIEGTTQAMLTAGVFATLQLTVIGIGGLILGAALAVPAAELTVVSARSDADLSFANSFALPPAQFLSLAVPNLFGNPKVPPYYYWGADFFEAFSAYAGLLPLLAIPLAFRWRWRANWYFVGMIAFGCVWSVGLEGALLPILLRWVPGFTLFRTPARGLFFVLIGMAGLTALLISALQTSDATERRERLRPIVRRWLPIAASIAFAGGVFFSGWYASASHVEPMPLRAFLVSGALTETSIIVLGV